MKSNNQVLIVVGKLLREKRQLKKLTLIHVAEYMAMSHTGIANIEHGKRRLDVGEFVTYCQYLKVKPSVLLDLAITTVENQRAKEKRNVASHS